MYHCHMLTHEDMGMMGQFLVVDPTSSIQELSVGNKELIKIVDLMGRETAPIKNKVSLIYLF